MRPILKPALRRLWRGDAAIQLGTDPAHGVVLHGVGPAANTVLALLDGTRDADEVVAAARERGVPERDVRDLVALLGGVHALDDAAIAPHGLAPAERERLEPDLASLSLLATAPGAGARLLDSRRATHVLVVGAGRLGALVAALLGAAGIGRVTVRDEAIAGAADAVPGGIAPADQGRPRALAAAAAVARAGAARADGAVRPPSDGDCRTADFAVLALDGVGTPPGPLLDQFAEAALPYVVTGITETRGVVGPLVVPGRTACPRCLDLHRAERDPGWPVVAAQLTTPPRGGAAACDVTLATGLAALTAGQVLAHLAPGGRSRCTDATLELRLPTWTVRRRAWRPHPSCGCAAGAAAGRARRVEGSGDGTRAATGDAATGAPNDPCGASGAARGPDGGAAAAASPGSRERPAPPTAPTARSAPSRNPAPSRAAAAPNPVPPRAAAAPNPVPPRAAAARNPAPSRATAAPAPPKGGDRR